MDVQSKATPISGREKIRKSVRNFPIRAGQEISKGSESGSSSNGGTRTRTNTNPNGTEEVSRISLLRTAEWTSRTPQPV